MSKKEPDFSMFFRQGLSLNLVDEDLVEDLYQALRRNRLQENDPLQFDLRKCGSYFFVEENEHTVSLEDACRFLLKLCQLTGKTLQVYLPFSVLSSQDSKNDRADHGGYVLLNKAGTIANVYYFDTKDPVYDGFKGRLQRFFHITPKPKLRRIRYKEKKHSPSFVYGWRRAWSLSSHNLDLPGFMNTCNNYDELLGAIDAVSILLHIPKKESETMCQILRDAQF